MNLGKAQSKAWVLKVLLLLTACWAISMIVALFANPEVKFWTAMVEAKVDAAKRTRSEGSSPMIFVGGGSSASFSIHPEVLTQKTGLPAVNMGGSAAMGYRYLINLAFSEAQAGDIVILHMTPESLTDKEGPTKALGIRVALRRNQFSLAEGGPIFKSNEIGIGDTFLALRPGTKFIGTIAAKILSGRPLYSYSLNHYSNGVLTIPNGGPTKDVEGFSPAATVFNEGTAAILQEVAEYAQSRKIRVFYTLAWECFQSEVCDAMRNEHDRYLDQVEKYIPVLRDSKSGVHDRPNDFLDTGFHMTLEAGQKRTQMLARSLQHNFNLESESP